MPLALRGPNGQAEPSDGLRPAGLSESSLCLPPGRLFRLVVNDRQRCTDPQKATSHGP